MLQPIVQAAPASRIARFRTEINAAIANALENGRYILGPAVETFEESFSSYLGVKYCVGVNSGTDAVSLSLRAIGIGPGDEVITTALTAAGTVQAILHCGAQPCFVDVDPLTRCIDPSAVEAAINGRTAAVVPVHLFGQPANMREILRIADTRSLAIVEDCAQAHGATIGGRKVGTFGQAGAFSFYPTKNLGCIGDGGAIVTNDASLAAKIKALRCYGWDDGSRISGSLGFNSRLDGVQAAILSVLLPHLDEGNRERQQIASKLRTLQVAGVSMPFDDPECVYHQFAIACDDRDRLRKHLTTTARIETAIHYHPALHRQPAFQTLMQPHLPETEKLSRQLLSLPIQPEVASANLAYIMQAIQAWSP